MDNSYTWLKKWAAAQGMPFAEWQPAMYSARQYLRHLPVANPHSGGHYGTRLNGLIARTLAAQIQKPGPPASPSAQHEH